eukprot:1282352-Pyramimonas_sp.AAC.1
MSREIAPPLIDTIYSCRHSTLATLDRKARAAGGLLEEVCRGSTGGVYRGGLHGVYRRCAR